MVLPHVAMGWPAVYDCGIPDHTHLLFAYLNISLDLISYTSFRPLIALDRFLGGLLKLT